MQESYFRKKLDNKQSLRLFLNYFAWKVAKLTTDNNNKEKVSVMLKI